MSISAREVKALSGAATKNEGLDQLYAQLEKRTWHRAGRVFRAAGYDRRKDLVHFTATWSAGPGVAGHQRVGIPMAKAIASSNGDLSGAVVLF